jgi:hypothetical protein
MIYESSAAPQGVRMRHNDYQILWGGGAVFLQSYCDKETLMAGRLWTGTLVRNVAHATHEVTTWSKNNSHYRNYLIAVNV